MCVLYLVYMSTFILLNCLQASDVISRIHAQLNERASCRDWHAQWPVVDALTKPVP